jgi:hypothetical protein
MILSACSTQESNITWGGDVTTRYAGIVKMSVAGKWGRGELKKCIRLWSFPWNGSIFT